LAGDPTKRQPGLDLEPRACSRRQRANAADSAAAEEKSLLPVPLDRRNDQAELQSAQPLQPPQALDDVLERLDAIPQPGRLLVAQALSQMRKPCPQARQRPTLEKTVELLWRAPGKRAGGERSPSAARNRAELGRCLGDDEILAPAPQ